MNLMPAWAVQHFPASLDYIERPCLETQRTTVNPNQSRKFLLGQSGKCSAVCYGWGEGKLECWRESFTS